MTDAAAVLGALGIVAALLGRGRAPVAAGILAIAAAELLLARELLPESLGDTLGSSAGALGIAVGLPALLAVAWLFVRYPAVLPPMVVGAAPFRFPFEVGADNRFYVGLAEDGALGRLVPLYLVLAAGALALLWRIGRGQTPRALSPVLAVPAALLAGLMTLSLLWAYDPAAADDRVTFFVLPLAVLLAVVARAPFRPWLPRVLFVEAMALASLFALVGLIEAGTRSLLFYDPKVAVANEYTSYFRVTSLFSDPSIYARHVAVALAILVAVLWLGRWAVLPGAVLGALLWAGMFVSYSQSSMIALAAGVVVVTFLAAGKHARRLMAIAAGLVVAAGILAFVGLLVAGFHTNRVTSGRSTLVTDTWTVFVNHPADGVGIASQPAASRDEGGARRVRRNVSHTAPLTVAAELGLPGILLYLAFMTGAVVLIQAVRRVDAALGLSLLAALTVLFVHSLFYGVFFDDPLLWATLGIAALAVAPDAVRLPFVRPAPAPAAR